MVRHTVRRVQWTKIFEVVCSHYIIYLDNEGDGEGFLLLTDEDIGKTTWSNVQVYHREKYTSTCVFGREFFIFL